jgi:3-hydroxyacyl-CoA dehydrogenase
MPQPDRDAAALLAATLRAAGLTVLPARDLGAGTLAQRLSLRLGDAVEVLLLSGLTPWDFDAAFCERGCALGPLEGQDLAGLDAALALRRRRAERLRAAGQAVPATPAQDRMVAEGRLGKAAGVGWYRYPGGGGAVIDPLVEDLFAEEAHFARHPRPGVAPEAAVEMALAALLHEGALALEDGTAADVEALDLTAGHVLSLREGAPGLRRMGATLGPSAARGRLSDLAALARGLIPPVGEFAPANWKRLDIRS